MGLDVQTSFFLALAFRYPDDKLAGILGAWSREEDGQDGRDGQAGDVKRWIRERGEDLLESLEVDYTGLFVSAHPHVPAPPYAAGRLAPENPGAVLADVREDVRMRGVVLPDDEREDHVSHLMLVVHALCVREEPRVAEAFARRWVAPWIGAFADDVEAAAGGPFYPAMARWLEAEIRDLPADGDDRDRDPEKGDPA